MCVCGGRGGNLKTWCVVEWSTGTHLNQKNINGLLSGFFSHLVLTWHYSSHHASMWVSLQLCHCLWYWCSAVSVCNAQYSPISYFTARQSADAPNPTHRDNALRLSPPLPLLTHGLVTCSFVPHASIHIICSFVPAIICLCLVSNKDSFVDSAMYLVWQYWVKESLNIICDPHKYHGNTQCTCPFSGLRFALCLCCVGTRVYTHFVISWYCW